MAPAPCARLHLANCLRALALPEEVEQWSLTGLREKLVEIGAGVARHGRYIAFQPDEIAVPRALFAEIMRRIDRLVSLSCHFRPAGRKWRRWEPEIGWGERARV